MKKTIISLAIVVSISMLVIGYNGKNTDSSTKKKQKIGTAVNRNDENNETNVSNQLEYGKPVRVTLAWNNYIYEVTYIVLASQEFGIKIGLVSRQVSPKPEINGDIARNTPEGPSITHNNGGKLYEIKDIESKKEIAIEISKGMYYKCKYFGKLL